MKIELKRKKITSVALISFTDIIFLLLIFILISSSFLTHSGITVNLPTSTSYQNEYNRNLNLTLTSEDKIFVDDEEVTWENLAFTLREKLRDDPEQVVVVRADQTLPLSKVVKLLDIAKLSGTNRFFIATEIISEVIDE